MTDVLDTVPKGFPNHGLELEDWEPLGRENVQELYQALGDRSPIVKCDDGSYALFRMDDVLAINKHRDVLGTGGKGTPSFGSPHPTIPLDLDGAVHTRFRKLLDPVFSLRNVTKLEPAIRALTNQLIDAFADAGEVELFSALCQPLPSTIFLDLVGLPQDRMDFFQRYKDAAIRPEGNTMEEREAYRRAVGVEMSDYLYGLLAERRAAEGAGDDLLSELIRAEAGGERLTDDEVVAIFFLLVVAGLDTVTATLSCIFAWLADHPAERRRLVDDPSVIPAAIEELMRYESPVFVGHRYPTADVEIGGQVFPKGSRVAVVWAAANLDPAHFPDPLRVDFDRPANRHIGFASGFHRCLGSHLARLELRCVIEEFHKRIPEYSFAQGQQAAYMSYGVRNAVHIPLTFTTGR